MSAPSRLPQMSPSSAGVQFTFTPNRGWRSSARDAAASQPPALQPASSAQQPTSDSSSASPLPFPPSSSLSISPTLGFDCSARTLPAMVSSRAHVYLRRHSSDPATPSPRRRKRGRRAVVVHSDDEWSKITMAGCEREAADDGLLETGSALLETEEVEEELRAITRQPLSILVSPVSRKQRPHCPVPLSPTQTDSPSPQSSACSSTASPRRPLFTNQIVSLGEGSALVLARRSVSKAETALPLAIAALSSAQSERDRLSQLLPFSPLAASSSSCSSLATPASCSATAVVCRSLSCDSAVRRCRSQWRRFHHAEEEQSGAGGLQRCASDVPQRRITPLLLPVEADADDASKNAVSVTKEEAHNSAGEAAGRGEKAAATRARRIASFTVKQRSSRSRTGQSQSQSRIVDFFSTL